jgi:hypothetical protein
MSRRAVALIATAVVIAYSLRAGHHTEIVQIMRCNRLRNQIGCPFSGSLAVGNYTSNEVHVFTVWSGSSHNPYECQIDLQRQYCELHGFSYKLFNDVEAPSAVWAREQQQNKLNVMWYKYIVLRSVIRANNHPGHWFLFVDNDVLFASQDVSMLEIINRAPLDADMILTPAIGYNAHFLLLKNTPWVREFLERIWRWRLRFPSCLGEQCAIHVALWDVLLLHKSQQSMTGRLEVSIKRSQKQVCCDVGRIYNSQAAQGCLRNWQKRLELTHPKMYRDTIEPYLNLEHPVKHLGPTCKRDISKVTRGSIPSDLPPTVLDDITSEEQVIGMARPLVLWRRDAAQEEEPEATLAAVRAMDEWKWYEQRLPERTDTCVVMLGTQAVAQARALNLRLQPIYADVKAYIVPSSQHCAADTDCACYEQPQLQSCVSLCNATALAELCERARPPPPAREPDLARRLHTRGKAIVDNIAEKTTFAGLGYEITLALRGSLVIMCVSSAIGCVMCARMLLHGEIAK